MKSMFRLEWLASISGKPDDADLGPSAAGDLCDDFLKSVSE